MSQPTLHFDVEVDAASGLFSIKEISTGEIWCSVSDVHRVAQIVKALELQILVYNIKMLA